MKVRNLAASLLLAGCVTRPISATTLIVSPVINNGALGTKTALDPYSQASIHHLDLKLFTINGPEVDTGISRTLLNAQLGNPLVFANLKPHTSYRVKAYAYASTDNSVLINRTATESFADIVLTDDDRPTMLTLAIPLIDRPFNGQATSSINLVNGGYSPIGTEGMLIPKQVSVYAGFGYAAGSNDGVASAARFKEPCGVAADNLGNLYVGDASNHLIRKINSLGTVSTLAGAAGTAGYTNGNSSTARFNFPWGLALDNSGNLYVTDRYSHTVRKVVVSSGDVSTLAGGAGTSGIDDATGTDARFNQPFGLVPDNNGNLYVADRNNHIIRKIVLSTGAVSTIAGMPGTSGANDGTGTNALFKQPEGLTLDGAGNLYITDTYNCTIRKMDLNSGYVSTIAGQVGTSGSQDGIGTGASFNIPVGIKRSALGEIYIADYATNIIRRLNPSTGEVTTVAGQAGVTGTASGVGSLGSLHCPEQLAIDANGNIFVGDRNSHTIRKLQ